MFKKLKDKITEEVKQSPFLQTSVAVPLTETVSSNSNLSSPKMAKNEDYDLRDFASGYDNSFTTVDLTHSPASSSLDLFPNFEFSIESQNHLLFSNLESNSSEFAANSSESMAQSTFTEEKLRERYHSVLEKYNEYRGRSIDMQKYCEELQKENVKAKNVLTECQDRAINRIGELKERCQEEEAGKKLLEQALRKEMEEKERLLEALKKATKSSEEKGKEVGGVDAFVQVELLKDDSLELESCRHEIRSLREETTAKENKCKLDWLAVKHEMDEQLKTKDVRIMQCESRCDFFEATNMQLMEQVGSLNREVQKRNDEYVSLSKKYHECLIKMDALKDEQLSLKARLHFENEPLAGKGAANDDETENLQRLREVKGYLLRQLELKNYCLERKDDQLAEREMEKAHLLGMMARAEQKCEQLAKGNSSEFKKGKKGGKNAPCNCKRWRKETEMKNQMAVLKGNLGDCAHREHELMMELKGTKVELGRMQGKCEKLRQTVAKATEEWQKRDKEGDEMRDKCVELERELTSVLVMGNERMEAFRLEQMEYKKRVAELEELLGKGREGACEGNGDDDGEDGDDNGEDGDDGGENGDGNDDNNGDGNNDKEGGSDNDDGEDGVFRTFNMIGELTKELEEKREECERLKYFRFKRFEEERAYAVRESKDLIENLQKDLAEKNEAFESLFQKNLRDSKEFDKLKEEMGENASKSLAENDKKWRDFLHGKLHEMEANHKEEIEELRLEWEHDMKKMENRANRADFALEMAEKKKKSNFKKACMGSDNNEGAESTPPMELEYLRNILYEYMMGKESGVLAKVIGAVVKFDDDQIASILEKEEKKYSLMRQLGL